MGEAFLERARRLAPELLDAQVDFDALIALCLRVDPDRVGIRPRRKRRPLIRQRRHHDAQRRGGSSAEAG